MGHTPESLSIASLRWAEYRVTSYLLPPESSHRHRSPKHSTLCFNPRYYPTIVQLYTFEGTTSPRQRRTPCVGRPSVSRFGRGVPGGFNPADHGEPRYTPRYPISQDPVSTRASSVWFTGVTYTNDGPNGNQCNGDCTILDDLRFC